MKKYLLFGAVFMALCMCLALGGALAEDAAVIPVYLVEGLPVYRSINVSALGSGPMTPSGPLVIQEDIDDIASVKWYNVPEGIQTTNRIARNENGMLSTPSLYLKSASLNMAGPTLTLKIDRKTREDLEYRFTLLNSYMKYNGALDSLDNLSYENGAYYLDVKAGDTITLENFLMPHESAADKGLKYFSYYWNPPYQNRLVEPEEVSDTLKYTVSLEDNGKFIQYIAYLGNYPYNPDGNFGEDYESTIYDMLFYIRIVNDGVATGVSQMPKTGDSSHLMLWAVSALCAAAAAVLLARRQRCRI